MVDSKREQVHKNKIRYSLTNNKKLSVKKFHGDPLRDG